MAIKFLQAGRRLDHERVFLTSEHRRDAKLNTIYHRNDWTTVWTFPNDFFRTNFEYDRSTGVYRTELRYSDINQYGTEIHH